MQQKITCKRRRQHQRQRQNHIQFALYQPRELLQRQTFVSFTPHTITDIPTLLQKLSECREAGYAIENGEYKIGLCSISAPVFTRDGTVAYTTGVPAMCGALMMLTGEWTKPGVYTVEEFNPDPFLDALDKYGLPRSESHSPALVD